MAHRSNNLSHLPRTMINSLLNDDDVRGNLKTDGPELDTAPVSDRSDKVVVSINRIHKDV